MPELAFDDTERMLHLGSDAGLDALDLIGQRELSRNTGTEGYASAQAREQSAQRRKAARPAIKLHADALLFDVVCHFLRLLWSPEQIALTLAHIFPKGHEHRV